MRIRPFPLIVSLIALLTAGLFWFQLAGANRSGIPPQLMACASCHSMEQEVTTWRQSPHKDVACLQCHTEGDAERLRREIAERDADMSAHPQGAASRTIPLKVPNERCLDCHAPQMEYLLKDQAPPPLKAPAVLSNKPGQPMVVNAMHDRHVNGPNAISCGECHLRSAHGPQAKTATRVDVVHSRCLECHTQKQVSMTVTGSVSCTACHTSVGSVTPKDHKNLIQWRTEHGKASATTGNCGECHLGESAGPTGKLTNPAVFKAGTQDACLACHGVQLPHPEGWMQRHTGEFKTSAQTCANCHGTSGQSMYARYSGNPAAIANTGLCKDCHLLPMPHTGSFISAHGSESYKMPQVCAACHSTRNVAAQPVSAASSASRSFCASCHASYQHSSGWVAEHGTKVTDSCTACHAIQGTPSQLNQSIQPTQIQHNTCAACHTGNDAWHPKMWFATHARAVETQGEATCAKCHDYVKPSCAECHRRR